MGRKEDGWVKSPEKRTKENNSKFGTHGDLIVLTVIR